LSETLKLNNRIVTYELIRKNIKNMYLRIKPDLTISITANPRVSKTRVENFIIDKSEWIEKTLENLEKRDKVLYNEMEFRNGDTYKLFGETYIINIIPSVKNEINIVNSNINIYTKDIKDKMKISKYWNKWYEGLIIETLTNIVKEILPGFSNSHINMPNLKFRRMKTRWGTCSINSKTITLNKALIHTPIECIEYVVVHELAHFIHPNHSKQFYQVVAAIMPDYKARKKLLENQILL
jgi:predicted metal-dependent hydrolase